MIGSVVWIVGRVWDYTSEDVPASWEILGVYDTEDAAVARCSTAADFVGPLPFNEDLPDGFLKWPGSYYPIRDMPNDETLLDRIAAAVEKESIRISDEFDKERERGEIDFDKWVSFEVATSLDMNNYTLVPLDYFKRLARAALRELHPCSACNGTGLTPMAPDFIGDDPKTMTIGTCSYCEKCSGHGFYIPE